MTHQQQNVSTIPRLAARFKNQTKSDFEGWLLGAEADTIDFIYECFEDTESQQERLSWMLNGTVKQRFTEFYVKHLMDSYNAGRYDEISFEDAAEIIGEL